MEEENFFLGLGAKDISFNRITTEFQFSNNEGDTTRKFVPQSMEDNTKNYTEQAGLETKWHEQRPQSNQNQNGRKYLDDNAENTTVIPSPVENVVSLPTIITSTQTPSFVGNLQKNEKISSQGATCTVEDIQKRIINAREIAQRFATTAPHSTKPHQNIHPVTANVTSISNSVYPYAQKRNNFLSTVHRPRLHACLLNNLDYLVKKDTELHQRQLQTLQQTMDLSAGLKLQKERTLSQRQSQIRMKGNSQKTRKRNRFGDIPKVVAGIGTQERKNAQNDKVAVYISGLPVGDTNDDANKKDKSSMSKTDLENVLKQLFGSYGVVSRVMLYMDKKTGRQKGDGLVFYDYQKSDGNLDNGHDSFLETVCSQLNGAELPCGSILSVEPADMEYNKRNTLEKNSVISRKVESTSIPSTNHTLEKDGQINEELTEDDKGDDNDDLDDFFASLE